MWFYYTYPILSIFFTFFVTSGFFLNHWDNQTSGFLLKCTVYSRATIRIPWITITTIKILTCRCGGHWFSYKLPRITMANTHWGTLVTLSKSLWSSPTKSRTAILNLFLFRWFENTPNFPENFYRFRATTGPWHENTIYHFFMMWFRVCIAHVILMMITVREFIECYKKIDL